jgi:hypothetical protein
MPPWMVTPAGAGRPLEAGWRPSGRGLRVLGHPPVWRVNRPGRRRRFENGWHREVWASCAPALRQMEGQPGRLPALVRSEMAPLRVWRSTRRPSAARALLRHGAGRQSQDMVLLIGDCGLDARDLPALAPAPVRSRGRGREDPSGRRGDFVLVERAGRTRLRDVRPASRP